MGVSGRRRDPCWGREDRRALLPGAHLAGSAVKPSGSEVSSAEECVLQLCLNTREMTCGDGYLVQQFCKSEVFATPQVFVMRQHVIQTGVL